MHTLIMGKSFPPAYEALKQNMEIDTNNDNESFPPAYEALKPEKLDGFDQILKVVPARLRGIETRKFASLALPRIILIFP